MYGGDDFGNTVSDCYINLTACGVFAISASQQRSEIT